MPESDGELGVGGAEACNKVILEGLDGSFCGIGSVDSRGYLLVGDFFLVEILLQYCGALVVKAVQLGSATGVDKGVEGFSEGI